MTWKDKISYLTLLMLCISGWFLGSFGGGFLSGVCLATMVLAITGKRVAAKAAARIDKRVKDILMEDSVTPAD